MLKRKHKKTTFNALYLSAVVVLLAIFLVGFQTMVFGTKVDATAARCAVSGAGGGVGSCFKDDGTPLFPVANEPNGPQPNHCYEVRNSSFGLLYFDVGCDQLPFNQNVHVVRCADGSLQNGTQDQTPEQICENNGGVMPSGESNKVEVDCKDPDIKASNCGIIRYILQFTNALSALVGVVVVSISIQLAHHFVG